MEPGAMLYEDNREFMVSYCQIRYEANREFMVSYCQIRYENTTLSEQFQILIEKS
jgi:hypothetical protein